jgi:hypothetical protein
MNHSLEYRLHIIPSVHRATETFGIRRLGELVAERFGVDQSFAEFRNPV